MEGKLIRMPLIRVSRGDIVIDVYAGDEGSNVPSDQPHLIISFDLKDVYDFDSGEWVVFSSIVILYFRDYVSYYHKEKEFGDMDRYKRSWSETDYDNNLINIF